MKKNSIVLIFLFVFISIFSNVLDFQKADSLIITGTLKYCNIKEICNFESFEIKLSFSDSFTKTKRNDSIIDIKDYIYYEYPAKYFYNDNLAHICSLNIILNIKDTIIDTLYLNKDKQPERFIYKFNNNFYELFINEFKVY